MELQDPDVTSDLRNTLWSSQESYTEDLWIQARLFFVCVDRFI